MPPTSGPSCKKSKINRCPHLTAEEKAITEFDARDPVHARLLAKTRKHIEDNRLNIGQEPPDIFDAENPEHAALLNVMRLEHPEMHPYILLNSLRFYLAGCLPVPGQKRRGRPPKEKESVSEIKGAVTVN